MSSNNDEHQNIIERQNQVIIALLARSTLGVDYISKIITSGKKKGSANNFIVAYNALDGNQSLTDIAKQIGTSKQNLSQIVQTWEEKGIVFNVGTDSRRVYMGLLKLPVKPFAKSGKSQKK